MIYIDSSLSRLNTKYKVAYLFYDSISNSNSLKKDIIQHFIKFLKSVDRFKKWLLLVQ